MIAPTYFSPREAPVTGATAAIVPAAGRGERFGEGRPKALYVLAGRSLLYRAVHSLAMIVDRVVVAAPPGLDAETAAEMIGAPCAVDVVHGGVTRQDSVAAALAALPADVDVVLVHDAARPLMPDTVARAVLAAVREGAPAVVPVLPLADTVKHLAPGGLVGATLDRSRLVAVQTPQGFRRDVLDRAHAAGRDPMTDDAGLVEALGVAVHTVPGHPAGFKITTPYDVVLAEALLRGGSG